jgi:hypothetical protein
MSITFKSTPENYIKELSGKKCNTCRKKDNPTDSRFVLLDDFRHGKINELEIQITNTETGASFTRKITDVTIFEEIYIISWRTEK